MSVAWKDLPQELLVRVFGYLDVPTLAACFSVNKDWHAAVVDDMVWKHLFCKKFGDSACGEQQQLSSSSSKSWRQRFKECLQFMFCFHPLCTNKCFLLSPDFTTIEKVENGGYCPKAVLSSELHLHRTGFTPQPQENRRTKRIPGLIDWHNGGTQEVHERQVMFTEWSGKLVELKFRASKAWDVGLFHVSSEKPLSFHPIAPIQPPPCFVKNLRHTYNMAVMLSVAAGNVSRYVWKEEVSSGLGETGGDEVNVQATRLPCLSNDWDYPISVRIDGREKGKERVQIMVDNAAASFPAPPLPFVLVFSSIHSSSSIELCQQAVSYT